MTLLATIRIRKTALCAVTVIALTAPALASAGWGSGLGSRITTVKTNASTLITNARENAPVPSLLSRAQGAAPEVFESIKDMHVLEQLQQTMGMVRQMQTEYTYFSGGEGCAATCASFRNSLKMTLNDVLALATEVPALNSQSDLLENLQRMSVMIDYMPPRALYLMWQTIGAKMEELEATVGGIRQTLASLPPLIDPATFGPNIMGASAGNTRATSQGRVCQWIAQDNKPVLDLIQARLEMTAWKLEKSASLIPDLSVKAEGGASAGAAVANGTASAAVGVKPTDGLKLALKLIALVPARINWAIKLNRLRAGVICR